MEKKRAHLPESYEIEPIEHDMYFALEKPLLDSIVYNDTTDNSMQIYATDYAQPTMDGEMGRVGVVISAGIARENGARRYDVTIHHYKEDDEHVLYDKDSHAYVLNDTGSGTIVCLSDAVYADGVHIARHTMNAVEHTMLLDELLTAREWQLASLHAHDILNK